MSESEKNGNEKTVLPVFEPLTKLNSAEGYMADPGLQSAVKVALMLGQPLLITGEPGTGKTQLAAWVANKYLQESGDSTPLLSFYTKSTSTAKDVFYQYDALRHFYDANHGNIEISVENYISYKALGLVILLSLSENDAQRRAVNRQLPPEFQNLYSARSVVLIDEIDKAPRDLPNDILNEIENMTFTVSETGRVFTAEQRFRPIIILTSNSEKDLPDAFLRRCIFYHIDFPTGERLKQIVEKRLESKSGQPAAMQTAAIRHFERIRRLPLKKKPSTAELLLWLYALEKEEIDVDSQAENNIERIASSYTLLAKYEEDKNLLIESLRGGKLFPNNAGGKSDPEK